MATIIAQTQKTSGFFGRMAQRLYNARLANAEREVKHTVHSWGRRRHFKGALL